MDYEPDFCTPGNFSNNPSTMIGTTERFQQPLESFRNYADDPRGSGYYGDPWWTSDQPGNRHHGWVDNTRFYALQAERVGMGPPTANVREEEQQRLAQLNIPASYLDFYPPGAYMRVHGYGPYTDMPADEDPVDQLSNTSPDDMKIQENFTNGQEPWYVSQQPWYSQNYADDIAYGTYESKRYQPIYRAAAEARTQELAALYNNGTPPRPGIENFASMAEYDVAVTQAGSTPLVIPAWCKGACESRYRREMAKRQQNTTEHLQSGTPFDLADKKKRTLVL
jgi:hypothetical protein